VSKSWWEFVDSLHRVDKLVAAGAEGDEVFPSVISQSAARLDVVYLEVG
jgi:hypothetical protein